MSKLYLVPIIHTSTDMGSLASALDKRATAELGHELWQKHKETISGFWDSIARFFDSIDVNGFKVYQDGLVVNGEDGSKIVNQGVKDRSRNYEIISCLLQRGAILVRTEDISLVKKEYACISKMAHAESFCQREIAALRYRLAQGQLLKQRDNFIAMRINETLREGETGILFIGAYHNIISKLSGDIKINEVKETEKVSKYQRSLSSWRRDKRAFEQLAAYLISPVTLL